MYSSSNKDHKINLESTIIFRIFDCNKLENDIKKYNITDKKYIDKLYIICNKNKN